MTTPDAINVDELFFKAGVSDFGITQVSHEFEILSKLQTSDFISKITFTKIIGKFYILFLQRIDGISINVLDASDERRKNGIIYAMCLLQRLYKDKGLTHGDLGANNIMIDNSNKIYIIDFEYSTIPHNNVQKSRIINFLSLNVTNRQISRIGMYYMLFYIEPIKLTQIH